MTEISFISSPWPHLVVDDFLPPTTAQFLCDELRKEQYSYKLDRRGNGRIEYAVCNSKVAWRALYSKSMTGLLEEVFEVNLKLDMQNLIQVRRMNNDTPAFPLHNDFIPGRDYIVCFLYLTTGWQDKFGGYLELYRSMEDNKPERYIAPLANRLVAFRAKPEHWHSVSKVNDWTRDNLLAVWNVVEPAVTTS